MSLSLRVGVVIFALATFGCHRATQKQAQATPKVGPPAHVSLALVAELMTGSFSSAGQAASDESFYDIRLEMAPVWKDRTDGHWLYVEQAAASNLDEPYRQRVYHLTEQQNGSFRSEIYSIPDPLRFVGEWKKAKPLAGLTADALEIREGCAVILRKDPDGFFSGGTEGKSCSSTLRGASYATSEVIVGGDRIESWDRGYDANGEQIWGAGKGPYIFKRE